MYHNILSHRCATNKYFQVIGSIHDIESYSTLDNTSSLNGHLFISHWVHLSIILSWLSSILFHLALSCTYILWVNNPLASLQISHGIWDPHLHTHFLSTSDILIHTSINSRIVLSYGGVYNLAYTLGFNTFTQIYSLTLILDLLSITTLILASSHHLVSSTLLARREYSHTHHSLIHMQSTLLQPLITYHLASPSLHIPSHTLILLSLTLVLWSTHLINIQEYSIDHPYPLTFVGGVKSNTPAIILSDISHHHLAIPIFLMTYQSIFSLTPYVSTLTSFYHNHPYSSIALSSSLFTHSTTPNITSQHLHSLLSLYLLPNQLRCPNTTYQ